MPAFAAMSIHVYDPSIRSSPDSGLSNFNTYAWLATMILYTGEVDKPPVNKLIAEISIVLNVSSNACSTANILLEGINDRKADCCTWYSYYMIFPPRSASKSDRMVIFFTFSMGIIPFARLLAVTLAYSNNCLPVSVSTT